MVRRVQDASLLIFSLDDTLLDTGKAFEAALLDIYEQWPLLHQYGSRDEVVHELVRHRCNGRRSIADAVMSFGRKRQIYRDALLALATALTNRVARVVQPYPEAASVLADLRSEYEIAVLANGGYSQIRKFIGSGLRSDSDAIFLSEVIGSFKPDSCALTHVLRCMGTQQSRAIVIGSNPELDIEPANNVGVDAIWLDDGSPWPVGICEAKYSVRNLEELREIL